ncbi:baculoviral IAP repeat containing deterin isoform X1 [Andrena cerasifolii]|uniref:baculoviral IAP repeat containing deterin isoform X1 n=1 Tax=Andrena cerasifolii TaxID=2819439 RepID=UPI0040377EFF
MDLLPEVNSTFWKIGRLKTFDHWPFQSSDENNCNPERMAAAGFLAIGGKEEPDLVECFICSKQLDGWDPDDDPWKEHTKHQPQCPFVRLNKLDETSWTVHDLFDLLKKYKVNECIFYRCVTWIRLKRGQRKKAGKLRKRYLGFIRDQGKAIEI